MYTCVCVCVCVCALLSTQPLVLDHVLGLGKGSWFRLLFRKNKNSGFRLLMRKNKNSTPGTLPCTRSWLSFSRAAA